MSGTPNPEGVPPGAPFVPQGAVPFIATTNPNTMDYPRLVYTAPRFEVVAIADIIEPSVLEACEALLPTLVPPYVNQAAIDAVNATAVRRAGDTMTGPLNLSPVIPTANAMAASKQYVDTMVATGTVPEVPPVPAGQSWARQTGQWVALAGGGTVTNIATGAGLTGGPITSTGTIAMANMNAATLKGNATGSVAAPTDLNVGQVMTMLGAAPLNSPAFTGSPVLPTGTQAITQPGGTSNTTVATTAFVANSVAAQLVSPVFTGDPRAPTPAPGDNDTSIATTAFVTGAIGAMLPLTGGTLAGPGNLTVGGTLGVTGAATLSSTLGVTGAVTLSSNLTVRGGELIGVAGSVPGAGALTLNANTAAPPVLGYTPVEWLIGANAADSNLTIDNFGTSVSNVIQYRKARGTSASQSAVQNGDYLGVVRAMGYGASAYGGSGAVGMGFQAAENWTAAAQGTSIVFQTTPTGSTTPATVLTLGGTYVNTAPGLSIVATAAIPNPTLSFYDQFGSVRSTLAFYYSSGQLQLTNTSPGPNSSIYLPSDGSFGTTAATAVKPGGGPWTAPSDARIKTVSGPYDKGLADVVGLNPVVYTYKGNDAPPDGTSPNAAVAEAQTPFVGLIAQEVEPIFPGMVRMTAGYIDGAAVDDLRQLDTTPLIFALVNAVKELSTRLTTLEGRAP